MANKKFRWRYFIDKPFQVRFIARFLILILLGLGISLVVLMVKNQDKYNQNLYYQIKDVYDENNNPTFNLMSPIDEVFNMREGKNIFELQLPVLIWMSALYLLLIAVFGLFISHKLAGPVYRIKKTLQEISDGTIKTKDAKFSLRKHDELKDLVEALNKFLEKTGK